MPNTHLADSSGYLKRMSKSLSDKLRVLDYFHSKPGRALDVGCADGTITQVMAEVKADWEFKGIDLNEDFLLHSKSRDNLDYEKVYLRDLLARADRFDVLTFLSVLHEFYSYGEGTSSVVKAMSDAHELLRPKGRIIIRDMVLPEYLRESTWGLEKMIMKISKNDNYSKHLQEFESKWGNIRNLYQLNHFLLKYLYTDNWESELNENYVGMSIEKYDLIFKLLGMTMVYKESYLIDYLRNRWHEDFGLTSEDTAPLRSTAILVAEK